jgi:uncharacterized protein
MSSPQLSPTKFPTPADLAITPRDRRFGRDTANKRWWLGGDPVGSALFTALSVTFPQGEAMFIESVKAHRDGVPAKLAGEIRAFVQQEVIHSREHVVFNRKIAETGYDLSELYADVAHVMTLIKERPMIVNLAATIALEHYTAMLAQLFLQDRSIFDGADPEWADMWTWHAIEEIEHKGVAYDTWLHATRGWSRWKRWALKSRMMAIISVMFWAKRIKGMKILLAQDGLTGWRVNARIAWYLLGNPGLLRRIALPWASYFLPGFHPWNHDDRALIGKYDSDYADAKMPSSIELAKAA